MKRVFLFLVLLNFGNLAFGQLKQFDKDPSEFARQVLQIIDDLPKNDNFDKEQFQNAFLTTWNSGYFDAKTQDAIIATSNQFINRRFRMSPLYVDFLKLLNTFRETNCDANKFNSWLGYFDSQMSKSRVSPTQINDFILSMIHTLADKIIYDNESIAWKLNFTDFSFRLDSTFKIIFSNCTLVGMLNSVNRDSTVIANTSGEFFPWEQKWIGHGGTVNWVRAGWAADHVNATLEDYSINLKKLEYTAENVTFINTEYIQQAVKGQLIEKVIAGGNGERAIYPQFVTYQKRFKLPEIFDQIDYAGGFSMEGAKFIGSGDKDNPAQITIKQQKKDFMVVKADAFAITTDNILSLNAQIKINIKNDSITHPNLTFRYTDSVKRVDLIRRLNGEQMAPFFNSFQNINMDVEYVQWYVNADSIIFRSLPGTPRTHATYTSIDYFDYGEFLQLQGMDKQHPLMALKNFATGGDEVPVAAFAHVLQKPEYQIRQMFILLAYKGFLEFKAGDESAFITQKLYDHLKYRKRAILEELKENFVHQKVRKGLTAGAALSEFEKFLDETTKDYDIIKIESDTVSIFPSAVFNLSTNNLEIFGIDSVPLSLRYKDEVVHKKERQDSIEFVNSSPKTVTIYPVDKKLTMQKNRDFFYDGELTVADLTFKGTNFAFKYDQFKLNLDSIDFLRFTLFDDVDKERKKVHHVIRNIKGDLVIDSVENKSGKRADWRYPIFNCTSNSKVFYSDERFMEVTYPEASFYAEIYPYQLDSLFDFKADKWKQNGMFNAGGIVPNQVEKFEILVDKTSHITGDEERHYSIGFRKKLPTKEILYGGKGTLSDTLKLSLKGLRGYGTLSYETSTMASENFIFRVDSMTAITSNFGVKKTGKSVNIPTVGNPQTEVLWHPYQNELFSKSMVRPFSMYAESMAPPDSVSFTGSLKVQPDSLSGLGILMFAKGKLESQKFQFLNSKTNAKSTSFDLKSFDTDTSYTFRVSDVSARIDYLTKEAHFNSNNNAVVSFPDNQYKCYMDQFIWNFGTQNIDISGNKKFEERTDSLVTEKALLVGSQFVSVHPSQDSLMFVCGSSNFNPRTRVITANEVSLIRVADATIFPSGPVIIRKQAVMDTLRASTIIADNRHKYHTIFNANTKIFGRMSYVSEGDYEYNDENKGVQTIHFDKIEVDSMFHTTGKGRIDINRKFLMSPNFAFYGTVKLEAKKPLLFFDGFTELRYNVTEQIPLTWIGFKAEINPLDIRIPLKAKVEDRINKPVFGGLMLTNDSSHVYSNFLTRWKQYSDNPVFSALPQARESLKVTKIEDLGKDKNKEEDVGADVKAEEDKPEADIKTDKPVDNPDPEVKANEQIPVAVQDTAAIALNMEGDIFIPKIDTISYLIFDKLSMRYKIASSEKLKDPNVVGNLYELHKTNGFAYSEGLMSLMPSLKTLRNIAAGTAIHNLNIDSVSFEVALGLDFIFPSKAMDILIDELDNASNLEAVDLTKPSIKKRFVELLGTENAAKTLENLSAGGYTVPKQLSRTFLFSDITLVWNTPSHSYRSVGKIGINNIQNQYVNKYLENAFIELSHTRRGDVVNIYLKVPGASDFFFSFTQNQMRAISTNTEFNEIIDLVKPKDRRFKTNFGYYSYILSSDMLKARFLRQFIKMEEQTIDNVTDPNEGQQIEEPTHGND